MRDKIVSFIGDHFTITWNKKNIGFGNFVFYKEGEKIIIDNEYMGRDFIKEILCELVDKAILESEVRRTNDD